MNANGVSTVSAAGAVAAAAPSVVKTGSTDGFAGALVQAMGGTGGQGTSSTGTAVPAGLLGLIGLLGAQMSDQSSQDLLQLLSGLSDQLTGMDANAKLPTDVQDQLAGLLQLFQSLLSQMGLSPQTLKADGTSGLEVNSDTAGSLSQEALSAKALPVIQQLQQSLKQLSVLLSDGKPLPADVSQFTGQLQNTMNALSTQLAAPQATIGQSVGTNVQKNVQPDQTKLTGAGSASLSSGLEQTAAVVAPEIRRSTTPLRNPVWPSHTTSGTGTAKVEGTATQAAIEPNEPSGHDGSAPAWTFLKGDNVGVTPMASANVPVPTQVPVQQFAEQMGKYLVKQFVLTQGNGTHEARISLHPEHLGQVDIKIIIHNGQLTARFVTENGAARDLLDHQMSQLRNALQGQGLQVERMEVVQQPSTTDSASFFQQNQRQPGSGQHDNGGNGRGNQAVYDDAVGFEAELERSTSLRDVGYGSSLNVKA
jgi:flagellar hook-length control protein FliK